MVYKSNALASGGGSAGTGGGTISNLTSTGGTITVGSPTGPTTNVDVANNTANTLAGYSNSGVFSDVSIGTNLSLIGGVLTATAGSGAVGSVFGRTGAISANYGDYAFNLISGVASVSQGGTGVQTLSLHGVLLGEGTANVSAATTGIAGRILIDQGNADPSFQVLSGDSSLASNGAMVNLAVHGVTYPAAPSTGFVPVVTSSNTVTYELVPNASLANSSVTVSGVSGVTGGGTVALGSSITLGMAGNTANTLAGYSSTGVFSDVSIGTNLNLVSGVLSTSAFSAGSNITITYSTNTLGITASGGGSVSSVFGRTGAVSANYSDYNFNLISGTASVSQGGTGLQTLTSHAVLLGEGVSAVSFATTGISGRLLLDQGNADPAFKVMSGDMGITSTGATSIISSVALTGNPTSTTQAAGDNSTKIATDAFVTTAISNAIAGVNPAVAVQFATTAASDTSAYTYNNGVSGVGATLTGANNVAFTADGQTATALLQRVLIKNDTQSPSGAFNGVYYVSQVQTAILPPILTRALDYNQPSDINSTGAIPVVNGTVNSTTSWLLTSTVNTVGTDPLTYVQFSLKPSTIITTSTAAGGSLAGTYPNPTIAVGAISGGSSISISTSGSVTGITYTGATAGVSSLNSITGAATITAGSNITISSAGSTLTIASTGGGTGISLGLGYALASGNLVM